MQEYVIKGRTMKITLNKINKKFSETFNIKDLDLVIDDNSFTTLLGPSGCGKTTVLRMISGLEVPDSGEILFDDKVIFSSDKNINIPPEKRGLGFVFQDFSLWPHMSVYENVAFPLRAKGDSENLDQRVKNALKTVRLDGYLDRLPRELSGGQQQRVAFARAISDNPDCVLFDEPLSALDAILREEMRLEITKIVKDMGQTAVFVTHDQEEAMSMSDDIIIMNNGHVEQKGSPEEIYKNPKTDFVAHFIGMSNWFDGKSMIRPEEFSAIPRENSQEFETEVISSQFLGDSYIIYLDYKGNNWSYHSKNGMKAGEKLSLYADKNNIIEFT